MTTGWAVWTQDPIAVREPEERPLTPARTVAVTWADEAVPQAPSGRRLELIGALMVLSAAVGAAITYL